MAAFAGAGIVAGKVSSSSGLHFRGRETLPARKNMFRISCRHSSSSSSSSVMDPYRTLRVPRDASEFEVKKAYRELAKQYHPDVCRGRDCAVQFHEINEAYDVVMASLREESDTTTKRYEVDDNQMSGMNYPEWDLWEEWMGWEGAGIRDYSSHINPYI